MQTLRPHLHGSLALNIHREMTQMATYYAEELDQQAWEFLAAGKISDFDALRDLHPDWRPCLMEVDFRGLNLRGVNFDGADLRGADLRGARLWNANLEWSDLRDAVYSQLDLEGARTYGARLS